MILDLLFEFMQRVNVRFMDNLKNLFLLVYEGEFEIGSLVLSNYLLTEEILKNLEEIFVTFLFLG
jgi:hypothetical protein